MFNPHKQVIPNSPATIIPHLVLRIHLGHHAVLQQVEGEHLQHVQLMCHLIVDGYGATNHILYNMEDQ